jgi:hypothetical protein
MPRAQRERDFRIHASDLQTRYGIAHDLLAAELPGAIRQVGAKLVRQLTSVRPDVREPWPSGRRRQLPIRWDLQWILRQVDIMRLALRADRSNALRRGSAP